MKRIIYNQPWAVQYLPAYLKVRPYTMVRFPSLVQVVELAHDLDARKISGAIVEAGCWKGGLVSFVAKHTGREVVGIDKFDGLNEPGEFDTRVKGKYENVKGHLAVSGDRAPLPHNARYVVGDAAESLPNDIALLRVDVDLYDDTKRLLQAARTKLVPGAWIVLDDYDDFEGARRAVHEFLYEEKRFPKIRQHPYGGSFYFQWR